jgi:hypothetical protein
MFSKFFSPKKLCRLRQNVEKYDTAGQATDGNIIRRMRIACWKPKDTNKQSEYVIHYFCTATVVTGITFTCSLPVLFKMYSYC